MTHEDGDAHVQREEVVEEVEEVEEAMQKALVRHTPYLEHVVATRQQQGSVLLSAGSRAVPPGTASFQQQVPHVVRRLQLLRMLGQGHGPRTALPLEQHLPRREQRDRPLPQREVCLLQHLQQERHPHDLPGEERGQHQRP